MTPEAPIQPDSLPEQPTSLPEGNGQAIGDVPVPIEYSAFPNTFDGAPTTLPEDGRVREVNIGDTQEVGTATIIPGEPAGPRTAANAVNPQLRRLSTHFLNHKKGSIGDSTLIAEVKRIAHKLFNHDPQETMKFDDRE